MRDVFGVVSIVIQNLLITQEDIEYDKKKWKMLLLTPERQDIQIKGLMVTTVAENSYSEVNIVLTTIWIMCVVQVQWTNS